MRLPFVTDWRTRRQARGARPAALTGVAAMEAVIARAMAPAPETMEARLARWRAWWSLQPAPRTRDELDRDDEQRARDHYEQTADEITRTIAREGVWSASWQRQASARDEHVWWEQRW